MLCNRCVADDHTLTTEGICECPNRCTCEFSHTDPEFNDAWHRSPYISLAEKCHMIDTASLPRATRIEHRLSAAYVRRAKTFAHAHGHATAD